MISHPKLFQSLYSVINFKIKIEKLIHPEKAFDPTNLFNIIQRQGILTDMPLPGRAKVFLCLLSCSNLD
jgi:hypothetical protein